MAYFHINDRDQSEVEIICPYNDLFITGLKSDQSIVHQNPSFMQRDNGLVIGVDQRFTVFYVVDKNMQILKKLHIEWSDCKEEFNESNTLQSSEPNGIPLGFISISLILVLIPLIWLKRRKLCK